MGRNPLHVCNARSLSVSLSFAYFHADIVSNLSNQFGTVPQTRFDFSDNSHMYRHNLVRCSVQAWSAVDAVEIACVVHMGTVLRASQEALKVVALILMRTDMARAGRC